VKKSKKRGKRTTAVRDEQRETVAETNNNKKNQRPPPPRSTRHPLPNNTLHAKTHVEKVLLAFHACFLPCSITEQDGFRGFVTQACRLTNILRPLTNCVIVKLSFRKGEELKLLRYELPPAAWKKRERCETRVRRLQQNTARRTGVEGALTETATWPHLSFSLGCLS
jgi:hypothetical protein